MGLIVLETIAKSKEAGKIELQIPENISQGNHKAFLFMEEKISEEWEDFYQFFGDLNAQEKRELNLLKNRNPLKRFACNRFHNFVSACVIFCRKCLANSSFSWVALALMIVFFITLARLTYLSPTL